MRIVALEEHFSFSDLSARVPTDLAIKRGYPAPGTPSPRPEIDARLADLGAARLTALDECGVSLQVLSSSGPGADLLPPNEGPSLAREINDRLAARIAAHPTRFAGFAHLPLTAPEAAAAELEHAVSKLGFVGAMVNGTTDGKFLDDPSFEPILAQAEALNVPIYVHPGIPPAAVREAYYSGLAAPLNVTLARAGFGWHTETAIHIIRLALSGTLDRHPKLQFVIGHLGEGLPAYLGRLEESFASAVPKFLKRPAHEAILDQVHVTTSGFYHHPTFNSLLQTFGADKILFSVDYPFSTNAAARRFLDEIEVSPADRLKIAHGNAEKLFRKLPR